MTTNTVFEHRANRGVPRGADEVLASARHVPVLEPVPARRRGPNVGAAVLVLCVVGAAIASVVVVTRGGESDVITDSRDQPSAPVARDSGEATSDSQDRSLESLDGNEDQQTLVSFAHEPDRPPRVVIDRPEFRVTGGGEDRYDGSEQPVGEEAGWVQVFWDPQLGYDGPVLIMQDFAVGTGHGVDGTAFDINGVEGQLATPGSLAVVLSWQANDRQVVLSAMRTPAPDVVAVARSATRRLDRQGFDIAYLPEGVVETTDEAAMTGDVVLNAEIAYELGDIRGDLWITSGDAARYQFVVLDRVLSGAELRHGTIGTIDVALIRGRDNERSSAIWHTEGLVFELRGNYQSLDEMAAVLEDIAVVDEETWQTLVPADWVAESHENSGDGVQRIGSSTEVVNRGGLTLVIQPSNIGPCIEVRSGGSMSGGCGVDLRIPLTVNVGSIGGTSFATGWAPPSTDEVVMTSADGEQLSIHNFETIPDYDMWFFLETAALSTGTEQFLPVQTVAYDADGNEIASFP